MTESGIDLHITTTNTDGRYRGRTAFRGVVGRTIEESEAAWPPAVSPPTCAPNILFIVLDDTGFGQLGCYGSPIATPSLDALAANGLLYSNMHTTAYCAPTRTCVLTGRNHHSNHMGANTGLAMGFPGYDGYVPFENGFLSEVLLEHGYATFAVGKWHLTPESEMSAAGPYNRWPLGRGFERYYGFLGGITNQYYPDLVYDNHHVEPPKGPIDGYHLTEDLVDHAIDFIADTRNAAPDKPFFLYLAPGATHNPHHVAPEWSDRYRGAFDDGWDVYRARVFERQKELGIIPPAAELPPRDADVAEWDTCDPASRRLYARMMEVYAGYLSHTDDQIGRLIRFLERIGALDDTMCMVLSDNGACPAGGPDGFVYENSRHEASAMSADELAAAIETIGGPRATNHYPWGWAWAGNTPFRRWKTETYRGGISDPFIVAWPRGIRSRGEIRSQFAHAIDMTPTILDILGIDAPDHLRGVPQSPIQGSSLRPTFDDATRTEIHRTQYFEQRGHRSIYHDGWRAVAPWPGPSYGGSRPRGTPITRAALAELDLTGWELYHVAEDVTESRDLASTDLASVDTGIVARWRAEERDVEHQVRSTLLELVGLWYHEAGKYQVEPLDSRENRSAQGPPAAVPRRRHTFYGGSQPIPSRFAPNLLNRSHRIVAELEVPAWDAAGAEAAGASDGMLVSHGGVDGGYALFVQAGRPSYAYNCFGTVTRVDGTVALTPGRHRVQIDFELTGAVDLDLASGHRPRGRVRLVVDDQPAGSVDVATTFSLARNRAFAVGFAPGPPVTTEYEPPFRFGGRILRVLVEVLDEDAGS